MASSWRQGVAPAYLLACLILGGSAQGIWQNMLLQLLGVAIIAWAAASPSHEPLARPARQLLLIALAAIVLAALQLVPLAPSLWAQLGPRDTIAANYQLLGLAPPPLPLSLTPYSTLSSLLALIPPLALICAIVRLKAGRASWLAAALLAGTLGGTILGALQVASPNPEQSSWYIYPESSFGFGVGFFANANHLATLLVITLPFLAAIAAAARGKNIQRYSGILAVVAGAALVVCVGLALNGSLAGYGLALPVLALSALIILPQNSRVRLWAGIGGALLLAGAVTMLARSTTASGTLGVETATSVQSRQEILATSGAAIRDFMPLGSGLGSFRRVYQLYESPDLVTPTYVIHAHNDYVELAMEMGLPGVLLMLVFLLWWAAAVWRVWRTAEAGPFARAASIASGAILAHSLVDFPLRTAAISTCFAMCLALLADRRAPPPREASDLRPPRHIAF